MATTILPSFGGVGGGRFVVVSLLITLKSSPFSLFNQK